MRSKWILYTKNADFMEWSRVLGVDPVIARILRNRDITSIEEARIFLEGSLEGLHSPWLLPDMDKAIMAIWKAIRNGKRIRIIGDYDVDGITSTYILYRGFLELGAKVDYVIPHRILDGYGLNRQLIEDAKEAGCELIVTCDNGIAAMEQVELAGSLGMDVVITDHHEVYEENGEQILPKALAVVDPGVFSLGQSSLCYPCRGICGAMVAFKVVTALLQVEGLVLRDDERFRGLEELEELPASFVEEEKLCSQYQEIEGMIPAYERLAMELIPYAALGTVCDVMELRDENRVIVKKGIQLMKETGQKGWNALFQVSGIEKEDINCYHLGFIFGPMINATGRLDTAERGIELFLEEDFRQAVVIATELKELNDTRKNLTLQGIQQAEEYIEKHNLLEKDVWLIYLPEVHESIAGIIAGKIREKYNHPTFIITKALEGLKGSGRSIDAYNMFEALCKVKDLLTKFGGHRKAAGLSFEEVNFVALELALNENTGLNPTDFIPREYIDVPMPLSYPTLALARALKVLEPNGNGNKSPMFAQKDVEIISVKEIGKKRNCLILIASLEQGQRRELTLFGNPDDFYVFLEDKYGAGAAEKLRSNRQSYLVSLLYSVKENVYRGEHSMQLRVEDYC